MSTATSRFHRTRALLTSGPFVSPLRATRERARTAAAELSATRLVETALIAVGAICLLGVRFALRPWVSADYSLFLDGWFTHLRETGFHGLGVSFSNYNMPYLYLLLVGAKLPVDGLTWVKTISALSDLALALGLVGLLRHFGASRPFQLVAGAAALLLPEVLLNSAAWGQADSTYSAFVLWAILFAIRGREQAAWVFFSLAFTFKMQAAFLLPVFVLAHILLRWRWRALLVGALVALATEIPALVAGRSPLSLATVYLDQASTPASLSNNAPSLYALLPEQQHDVLKNAGMLFALACIATLCYAILRASRTSGFTARTIILLTTSLALLAPYTLPTMHERYFYLGDVLLFLYALIERRFLKWAFIAQVVAVLAYSPFLLGIVPVVPMAGLALVEGAVLFVVIRELLTATGISSSLVGALRFPTSPGVDREP